MAIPDIATFNTLGKLMVQKYERYLPTAFDESMTLLEKVNKMIEFFNKLIDSHNEISDVLEIHGVELVDLKNQVNYIQNELEKVRSGDYVSLYLESIENWINTNLKELVSDIAKFVWFGLNDDGYFVVYIPESWDSINFDTTNNGELVLEY